MLPDTMQIALKEWAVVQRALLEQHQIVLLRKGGIVEDTGEFDLKSSRFLIYPTYAHETEREGDVQPCFSAWLSEEEVRQPHAAKIRIECACEVTDVVRLSHPDTLLKLTAQHIWSPQFIHGRFDWEPYKPLFALLVRAYRLPEPQTMPYDRSYGGCRSWVTLQTPVSTSGALPAIASEERFERRRLLTRQALCESAGKVTAEKPSC